MWLFLVDLPMVENENNLQKKHQAFKEVEHLLDDRFAASIRGNWAEVNATEMILGIYGYGSWKLSTPETKKAVGAAV